MNYEEIVRELESRHSGLGLVLDTNPFVKALKNDDMSDYEIKKFIEQYSQFSCAAIHMLFEARIRTHHWEQLRVELDRNIEEEEGLETGNIPHLEIMREGYLADFGIDTDRVERTSNTQNMIENMFKLFESNDNAFNAGALLAFESIAHEEFRILDFITKEYAKIKERPLHKKTNAYIQGHLEFEIGHKEGLKFAIAPYINEGNALEFGKGYALALYFMSSWWNNITKELTYL